MATTTEEIKLKFIAETNTQSFKNLQSELEKIQLAWAKMNNPSGNRELATKMETAAVAAGNLERAMAAAFNPKLNTYNLDVLKQKLKESGTDLKSVINSFNALGMNGQSAVLSTVNSLTSLNLQLNKSKTIVDRMGEGLMKVFSWSIYSSTVNRFTGAIQEAYGYVKALDSSLNDIRIVTGKSADEMDRFAETANKTAIALGKGTKDYTDAALIYYQQGLSDAEVKARTDITLKTASVTQQSTQAVSEELTAIWNGYKVQANEAELYIDKVAAVAATTAADLEELATGMSKVASAANSLGVDVDQMNAMLATTVSVTRQSPETVGVAYKTILARMSQLKVGGEDEDGTTLGRYTEQMRALGFDVIDKTTGQLRDMGDVVEEIGNKWETLSKNQQIALAQVVAGNRQYNNLIALFDNWDMYEQALQTSADAAGTLNEQQDIFMESTEAHLQQMRTAAEGVYDSLLDNKTLQTFIDDLTKALQITEQLVNGFGGLKGILLSLSPVLLNTFSGQIANNVVRMFDNMTAGLQNKAMLEEAFNKIQTIMATTGNSSQSNDLLQLKAQGVSMAQSLTPDSAQELLTNIQAYGNALTEVATLEEQRRQLIIDSAKELNKLGIAVKTEAHTEEEYAEILEQVKTKMNDIDAVAAQRGKNLEDWNNITNGRIGSQQEFFNSYTARLEGLEAQDIKGIGQATSNYVQQVIDNIAQNQRGLITNLGKALLTNNQEEIDKLTEQLEKVLGRSISKIDVENPSIKGAINKAKQNILDAMVQNIHGNAEFKMPDVIGAFKDNVTNQMYSPELREQMQKFIDDVERIQSLPGKQKDEWIKLHDAIKAFTQSLKDGQISEDKAKEKLQEMTGAVEQLENQTKQTGATAKNTLQSVLDQKGFEILAQRFVKITSLVVGLTNTIKSVQRAIQISTDSTASMLDKISAWGSALMSASYNIASIISLIRLARSETEKETIVTTINTLATNLKAKADIAAAKAAERRAKANGEVAASEVVEAGATETSTATTLSASLKNLFSAIGNLITVHPVLVAIIAIIAAIIAVLIRLYNEWKKADKALEKANNNLKEYTKNLKEAKNQLNSFDQSVSSLEQMEKELNKLTKGSKEWNEQLKSIHEQTAQLLEDYPELSKYATWSNGGWTISKEGLEQYQKQLNNSVNSAIINQQVGQIAQISAQRDVIDRDISWQSGHKDFAWYEPNENYNNTLKTTQEIQEKINQARLENNQQDEKYWQNILDYKEKSLELDQQINNLARITIDKLSEAERKEVWGNNTDIDRLKNDYFLDLEADKTASVIQAKEQDIIQMFNYGVNNEWDIVKSIKNENKIKEALKNIYANRLTVPPSLLKVTGDHSKGYTIFYQDQKTELSLQGAAYTIGQEEVNKTNIDQEIKNIDKITDYSAMLATRSKEELISNYSIGFLKKYGQSNIVSDSLQDIIKNNIHSDIGDNLFTKMTELDTSLSIEEFEELGKAIEEVYLKEGPDALQYFLDQLASGQAKVKDFMTFDFGDSELIFTKETEDRMKNLKVTLKDLERYKTKFQIEGDLTEEDANRIMNYIEAQKDLNTIYKDRERIFEILKKGDKSSNDYIENITLLSNAINTRFGVNVSDDDLIKYLSDIELFLNGDVEATQRLAAELNSLDFTDLKEEYTSVTQQLFNISSGDVASDASVEKLKEILEKQGLGDKLNFVMESMGFELNEEGHWVKKIWTVTEQKAEFLQAKTITIPDTDNPAEASALSKAGYSQNAQGEWYRIEEVVDTYRYIVNEDNPEQIDAFLGENGILAYQQKLITGELNENDWELTTLNGERAYVRKTVLKEHFEYIPEFGNAQYQRQFNWLPGGPNGTKATNQTCFDWLASQLNKPAGTYKSWDDVYKDWISIDSPAPGIQVFEMTTQARMKFEAEQEPGEGADATKPIKYTKKVVWENKESDYNYFDQLLKDNQQKQQVLKEEMEDLSGDALIEAYEKENALLEERLELYKQLNEQNAKDIQDKRSEIQTLGQQFGVEITFDENGYITKESYEAFTAAYNARMQGYTNQENAFQRQIDEASVKENNQEETTNLQNQKTEITDQKSETSNAYSKFQSLAKDINQLVYDTNGNLIEINKLVKESAKIDISKKWVKFDEAVKQSDKDIEHLNKVIQEMEKENEYLDFEGQMKNAKDVYELQLKQAEEYKKQIKMAYQTITTDFADTIKNSGINFEDLLSMDPVKIDSLLMDVDKKIQDITSKGNVNTEELEFWKSIRERIQSAYDISSKYNDILRETKVNTNKVKEATDQIETSKIEHTITQLNRELNVLKKAQSDLKGQALVNNLKQQLAIQQKIVAQEQKKLAVMKQQTHELTTQMQQQLAEVGISAQIKFNEDGSLANYYEIVALIEKAVGLNRQERDILLDKLNILNKSADAQAKQFDQLQSAKDNATDLAKQIKKAIQEELKNTFNAKVDVELNIEEAWRQLHKLRAELQGLKDTDYLGNINLQMRQFQEYLRTNPNSTLPGGSLEILTQHLNDIMTEIGIMQGGGTSSIYGTDQSAAFSDLENYRNQLASTSQAAMDAVKEMKQTYLSAIDALITANNNYIASLEQMNTILNNTSNIIKLVYGENAYSRIQKYLDGQISVNQQMAIVARQNANDYYIRAQNAQTKEETEKWLNAWKDAVNQYYQYSQKVLEAYKQSFDNMLNDTAEKAKGVWSTGIGANGLMFGMDWELEKKKTEDWYDYTNSLFQRNTLQAKIAEDIENASVAAAQKLAQAETEIIGRLNEQLRLNKQLSKYEVDRANKLYELTKKQIALEEARENKTKMRLRRDSAGNYRYEYVADEDKVDKAQQEVDKAENDMYNFYKDAITKAVDKDKALKAEFGDKLKEIFGNKQLTPEQQAAQAEKLWDMYFGAEGFVTRNAQTINQALTDIQPYSQGGIDEFLNEARMVASDTPDHKIIETLSETNGNYRAMSEALAEEIEGYSVSDLDVSREIADYNAAIAEDMKTQVDQIAQVLEVLASYEVYLNGLLESAMGTYEASLYLREKSDAASKAAADDKASGAAASGGGVAPRDDGATVDYYVAKNDKGGKDIVFNSDIISQGDLNRYLNDKEKLDKDKRRLIEAVLKKEGLTEEDLRKLDKDGNLINALGTNMNYFSSDQNVQHKIAGRGDTTPQERQAATTKTTEEKKEEEKKTETSKIPYYKVSDGVYTADPSYKAKEAELIKWIAEKTGKAAKDIKIDWDAYGEVKSKKEAKKYTAEIAETVANTEASLGEETASDIVNTAASAAQNNDIATATMEYQKASTAYLAKMADKDFKIEQNVEITPNFPGVKNSNEIIDAFNKMKEQCTQKISEDAKKV